jgi:protocatechuate 3,4-dioxygenase beta subunit
VAHPGLVRVALEVFDQVMPQPNQIDRKREDVRVSAADLVQFVAGPITEAGLRTNISVAIQYIEAWLGGQGAVPIFNLMEDAATAEISRSQVWQWIHSDKGVLDDGRKVTVELVRQLMGEELDKIRASYGDAKYGARRFKDAADLFDRLATDDQFVEFLTLPGYRYLDELVADFARAPPGYVRSEEGEGMERSTGHGPTRRDFLRVALAAPATYVLAACAGQTAGDAAQPTSAPAAQATAPTAAPTTAAAPTQAPAPPPTEIAATAAPVQVLAPTPACGDDDEPTPAQTEGPYYTPNTPERASLLEPGMAGTKLVVTGTVLTTGCQPVARALLDFWQADDAGQYDNAGFKLRGHQFADDQGRFTLETIVPGLYPGRTRHIHVKVQAPNQPVLTSQLYFPGEAANDRDGIFNPALLMDVQDATDGKQASFNFVLDVA